MSTKTIWGSINADGSIASGSRGADEKHDFSVTPKGPGTYEIGFSSHFVAIPAIVGTQNRYGTAAQNPDDGVVFPEVLSSKCTAVTGASDGVGQNRSFAFIAIGH